MPRHMLPNVGTIVWYFADPTRRPQAAVVAKRKTDTIFNLSRVDPQTGAATPALDVPFLENPGLKPASGPYCTPTGIQDTVDGATDVTSQTQRAASAVVTTGGTSGYVVGDILTHAASGATFRVATVSTGVVATVTVVNGGSTVKPGPGTAQAVTGGSGTGAVTLTITWADN